MISPVKRLSEEDKTLQKIEINVSDLYGKLVAYNPKRVKEFDGNNDLIKLALRHADDNWSCPVEINQKVLVNFYGSIFSNHEIDLPETALTGFKFNNIDIEKDDYVEYDFVDMYTTLFDYRYNLPIVIDRLNNSQDWYKYDKEGNRL